MSNLRDWKSNKFDEYRAKVKAQVSEGIAVSSDHIIDEDTLQEIHDEVAIEKFQEVVDFDYEIELDEALETDLNDAICDCPDDEKDAGTCSCPETFYDFIPDEFGELMDVEFEIDGMRDHYDDGVNNYLKIKDAMFASSNEPGGTSYRHRLEDPKFTFAGKTGSSQIKRFTEAQREAEVKQESLPYKDRDHALFVAFAPYKNPQYAISVLVEHGGSGGKAAAPIAKKVIKKVLERHELRRSINNQIGETV